MPDSFQALVAEVVAQVSYKPGWTIRVGSMGDDGLFVQWALTVQDESVSERVWSARKWYVSPHATRSEIVQTLLLAVLAAEEHEAREAFRFKGLPVFGPHHDVDKLAATLPSEDRRL